MTGRPGTRFQGRGGPQTGPDTPAATAPGLIPTQPGLCPDSYILPRRAKVNAAAIFHEISQIQYAKIRLLEKENVASKLLMDLAEDFTVYMSALYYSIPLSQETVDKIFEVDNEGNPIKMPDTNEPHVTNLSDAAAAVIVAGYATTVHLAKAITTDDDIAYIHERFTAIGADCRNPTLHNLTWNRVRICLNLNALSLVSDFIQAMGVRNLILEDALTFEDVAHTELQKAIVKSIKMVLEGYGMTAVMDMEYFTTIVTKAMLLKVIRNESKKFKMALADFRDLYGNSWKLGRLLNLPGVDSLDTAKYPHLYYCTIARLKGGSGSFETYPKSDHPIWESPIVLQTYAQSNLTTAAQLTQNIVEEILYLTGKDLSNMCIYRDTDALIFDNTWEKNKELQS